MAWALTLLHDPETLMTYEDFAMEAAYEMEDTHPPATNPPTRRTQNHPTPPSRHRRTEITNISQEGIPTGTTRMDVDQDMLEGTTPPGTSFEDDHTTHQQGNDPFQDPPIGIHTRNFFHPSTHNHKKPTSPRPTQTTQPYSHQIHAS